jgi:hypothetical protein
MDSPMLPLYDASTGNAKARQRSLQSCTKGEGVIESARRRRLIQKTTKRQDKRG